MKDGRLNRLVHSQSAPICDICRQTPRRTVPTSAPSVSSVVSSLHSNPSLTQLNPTSSFPCPPRTKFTLVLHARCRVPLGFSSLDCVRSGAKSATSVAKNWDPRCAHKTHPHTQPRLTTTHANQAADNIQNSPAIGAILYFRSASIPDKTQRIVRPWSCASSSFALHPVDPDKSCNPVKKRGRQRPLQSLTHDPNSVQIYIYNMPSMSGSRP